MSERLIALPEDFRDRLELALAQSGEGERLAARNPGEPFRQFTMCMLGRLDLTIACAGCGEAVPVGSGYSAADNLVEDLRAMELALEGARAPTTLARCCSPSTAPRPGWVRPAEARNQPPAENSTDGGDERAGRSVAAGVSSPSATAATGDESR